MSSPAAVVESSTSSKQGKRDLEARRVKLVGVMTSSREKVKEGLKDVARASSSD